MATPWAAEFAWLAVQRHLAGGSHAEDLGFTDQVLANFLRGQWFRMSIYQGATWNTEIDVGRIARPDSLFAFHFEPMLLLLLPLYALGGISLLLVVQAVAMAAGAVPAYRLGRYWTGSGVAGLAVVAAYLLSPLGQWAVLDDFHTSILAAPLLLLAVERLVVKKSLAQTLVVAALAATAREDVGPVLAVLGAAMLAPHAVRQIFWRPIASVIDLSRVSDSERLAGRHMELRAGLALLGLGLGASVTSALVIRSYNGDGLPFDARYADTVGRGVEASLAALVRPDVLRYGQTLLASGGWLGILAPLALVPALPILALNALSTSAWMAAGEAHYSGLVLPFIVLGAAAGLRRVRARPGLVLALSVGLVSSSALGYLLEGSGPLGANYAPASVDDHAGRAASLASSLPPDAPISASAALVPRLSQRARVYVFPAVLDAEYVFVDLRASPSPTSAGDVFLRTQALAASGEWQQLQTGVDDLLLLHHAAERPRAAITPMLAGHANTTASNPLGSYADGRLSLLAATLAPDPDGAIDVDGPRWILRTTWRAEQPLPPRSRLEFWLTLRDGRQVHVWDVAPLWWNPPERWTPGQPVTIDLPDVPLRQFVSWQAEFSSP